VLLLPKPDATQLLTSSRKDSPLSTIQLNRKIIVKSIVTEDFKNSFISQLKQIQSEINGNIEKIKTEESRLLISGTINPAELSSFRARLNKERESQEVAKLEVEDKIKEIEKLEIGSIYPYTSLDSNVSVKEGDNLFQKINQGEILVRDGVIVSIKE
jgi:hypothetical protein